MLLARDLHSKARYSASITIKSLSTASRLYTPEIMDDFTIGGDLMDRTLLEIEKINKLLGGNNVTINGIDKLLKKTPKQKMIHIADLGCGGGDMSRLIQSLGFRRKIVMKITGIDANPHIIDFCNRRFSTQNSLRYECLNILSEEFKQKHFDIITATLFVHHFTDEALISMLKSMKRQATTGIVINDLHRHWFAYHAIKLLTRLFSNSEMVRHDAPVSVRRAFTKRELMHILHAAGIKKFEIKWRWAFRWQIIIES